MKQLIWKEWHELRWLPLASVLCVVVLTWGSDLFWRTYHHDLRIGDVNFPLSITWGLFSLLTGASLFASEVGSGTLDFLSVLPLSRRRLWCIKISTASAALLLSWLTSSLVWAWLVPHLVPAATPAAAWLAFWLPNGGNLSPGLLFLDMFAVTVAVSAFADRALSVLLVSALVFGATFFGLAMLLNEYLLLHMSAYTESLAVNHVLVPAQHSFDVLEVFSAVLSLLVFASISYWTFTRGETLRSAKRFRVGALSGLVSAGIAALIFWVGSGLQWW